MTALRRPRLSNSFAAARRRVVFPAPRKPPTRTIHGFLEESFAIMPAPQLKFLRPTKSHGGRSSSAHLDPDLVLRGQAQGFAECHGHSFLVPFHLILHRPSAAFHRGRNAGRGNLTGTAGKSSCEDLHNKDCAPCLTAEDIGTPSRSRRPETLEVVA